MNPTRREGRSSDRRDPSRVDPGLAQALDIAPVPIWVSGPDKQGIHFNRAWLDFTGRGLEQELGEGWMAGVHPNDLPALEACADAFERREPFEIDFRLRRGDGAWRWVLDKAVPRLGPDGSFEGFIGSCIDITERKDTEAALRSSEQRLQLAQEAAAVGTYDWDVRNDRIDWSPEMYRLHGIDPATPADRLYDAWLARLHPEDRERADRETRAFLEQADRLKIEFRMIDPDGGVRWIQGRGRMIRDEAGAPIRMVGANFDVTERRAAEEALRESEQRIRDVAENFPGIIFRRVTHPDGRVEYPYFSGADQHIFHIPQEQLKAIRTMEDVTRLVHFEDLGEMLAKFEQAKERLSPLDIEGRIVSDDGEVRWVRSISRPRPRGDGALIWDGVLIDVTDRHRQQGERDRAAAMLRMAMEVAGIGTWEFDPATGTAVGSAFTKALFGVPEGDEPHPIEKFIEAIHPDDAERVRGGLLEAAAGKATISREYRVIAPDGSTRWVSSRGSHVRLADGSERMIGAISDTTERKRQEEEREAALRQHKVLLRELDHRVKNNLQMVTSMLRLQATRVPDPIAREQFARAIERVQTIGDLHAQLRVQGGSSRIEFSGYLHQLCEKLRRSVLAETRIELLCESVPYMLDLDKAVPLGLIVNELVTNSIKHAFPGNHPGSISITLDQGHDDSMVLTVGDSGTGVSVEHKAGRGLGMQLVEGLRQQVGASIETVADPGFAYVITIPADAARRPSVPTPTP